jgi:hypothetical protein
VLSGIDRGSVDFPDANERLRDCPERTETGKLRPVSRSQTIGGKKDGIERIYGTMAMF